MTNANVALLTGSLTVVAGLVALGTAQSMEYIVTAAFAAVMGGFIIFLSAMIGGR